MEAEISESLSRLRQIGSELGVGEESQPEAIEEDSFDYTERVLFSEIREIKNLIERRDKESLVCTNRRDVIELNSRIYRKLKDVVKLVSDLEAVIQKESKRKRKEKKGREEVLIVIIAQIKRLQSLAAENHAPERSLQSAIHSKGSSSLLPATLCSRFCPVLLFPTRAVDTCAGNEE